MMRGPWNKWRVPDRSGARLAWPPPAHRGPAPLARRVAPQGPEPVPEAVRPPDVTVRLLGPFEIAIGAGPASRCTSFKGLTVLKFLLMHGGRARREELMELLWRGYRPQSARNNLNVAIYALRRAVEASWGDASLLVYSEGRYLLNPDLLWWTDLEEFSAAIAAGDSASALGEARPAAEAYLRAAGLYRGPLLEDEAHGDWWLDEQRVVQERYLAASESLAEIYLDAGDVGGAVAVGEDVLRTDPCRESAHRLLMRCFALQSQGQLIARQFRRCTEVLERELGLRPAGETLRLYRELTRT